MKFSKGKPRKEQFIFSWADRVWQTLKRHLRFHGFLFIPRAAALSFVNDQTSENHRTEKLPWSRWLKFCHQNENHHIGIYYRLERRSSGVTCNVKTIVYNSRSPGFDPLKLKQNVHLLSETMPCTSKGACSK